MIVDVVSNYGYRGQGAGDGGMWFFGNNGIDYHFQYCGHADALKAYQKCPPISAIINRKAQAFINGKTEILNSQSNPATSSEAKKIRNIFKNPNPLQSAAQFEAQAYIYLQLFGYCPVLRIKPFGFPDYEATALWNIPPFMIDIKETNKLWMTDPNGVIDRIILNYKGQKTVLNLQDIFLFKDFTPSFTSIVIPESRIKALSKPINNIIGAFESRNVLINYRGALGILTPEKDPMGTIPLSPDDKENIQQDFKRYGLKDTQWQVIISNAALKWQQMGYATKDLMLFEEVEDSTKSICDQYGYPYRLLNYDAGTLSGSDVKEFKKQLYQDSIIPEANSFYEQWNALFETDKYNLRIGKNYEHVAVLQEDMKLMAEAMFMISRGSQMDFLCNVITLNQWRKRLNVPETSDGNLYYSDIKDLIGIPKITAGEMTEQPASTSTKK